MPLKHTIFREYDIRGLAHGDDELTLDNVRRIVNAYLAYKPTQRSLIIGSDYRSSSDEFREIATATAVEAGREVVDIGTVTTPMFYFAQYYLHVPVGIMITASHDPPDWNGFILADGYSSLLIGEAIQTIRNLAAANSLPEPLGKGSLRKLDIREDYIHAITCRVRLGERRFKLVIDCGNATAGFIASAVFERLGMDVVPLYCEPDFRFPHHSPDPSNVAARGAARAAVRAHGADLALLFDGDGDRLGVIDNCGEDVGCDQVLLLFSLRLLDEGQPPTVVFDVNSTQALEEQLSARGGVPIMWKTGHPHIRQKSMEAGADLAGDPSGHIFIFDRWFGFDDPLFAGACLLECLSRGDLSLHDRMLQLPRYLTSPEIRAHCTDEVKYDVVERLTRDFKRDFDKVIDVDGARVAFPDGWGLVRASSNLPELVFVFEAKSEERLREIYGIFRERCEKYPEISRQWQNDLNAMSDRSQPEGVEL